VYGSGQHVIATDGEEIPSECKCFGDLYQQWAQRKYGKKPAEQVSVA
jgi:hypothetical protein